MKLGSTHKHPESRETMKNTLINIIKFLSKNDFYYCVETGELYNIGNGEMCYCADDIYQEAHDAIYVAFAELFNGYRIDTKQALTEDFQEEILNLTHEKADLNHYYFNNMTQNEALQVIQEHQDLEDLLLNTYQE